MQTLKTSPWMDARGQGRPAELIRGIRSNLREKTRNDASMWAEDVTSSQKRRVHFKSPCPLLSDMFHMKSSQEVGSASVDWH